MSLNNIYKFIFHLHSKRINLPYLEIGGLQKIDCIQETV